MVPIVSVKSIPCPDPDCVDGVILVNNAYSENPLVPEPQKCDQCGGRGYIISEKITEN